MAVEIAHAPQKIQYRHEFGGSYIHFPNLSRSSGSCFSIGRKSPCRATLATSSWAISCSACSASRHFPWSAVLDNRFLTGLLLRFSQRTGAKNSPQERQSRRDEVSELLARRGLLSVLADQHAGPVGMLGRFLWPAGLDPDKAIAVSRLTYERRCWPVLKVLRRRAAPTGSWGRGRRRSARAGRLPAPRRDGLDPMVHRGRWSKRPACARNPEQYWWVHRRWKDMRGRNG